MSTSMRRRDLPFLLVALAGTGAARAATHQDEGLTFSAEALHQEIAFKTSRAKIYAALLDAKQFDAIARLGVAMRTMHLGTTPTAIDAREGGAFTLFGGHIAGRTIELVPDTRIVQAWREKSWAPGVFSLVSFALSDAAGGGAKLIFDHTGFPAGAGHHLSLGWYENYWEPMGTYLG